MNCFHIFVQDYKQKLRFSDASLNIMTEEMQTFVEDLPELITEKKAELVPRLRKLEARYAEILTNARIMAKKAIKKAKKARLLRMPSV